MDSNALEFVVQQAELAYARMQGATEQELAEQAQDREVERELIALILLGTVDDNESTHVKWVALKNAAGWRYGERYSFADKTDFRLAQLFSLPPTARIRSRLIFQLTRILAPLVTITRVP